MLQDGICDTADIINNIPSKKVDFSYVISYTFNCFNFCSVSFIMTCRRYCIADVSYIYVLFVFLLQTISNESSLENNDKALQIDISDALSEKDKVKFTVHTKTTLPDFQKSEFLVVRQHEEFVWLHDRFEENEEYAGYIVYTNLSLSIHTSLND
jgi:hypothetical protein